jgi:CHAT domain-containing protein
LLEAGENAEGPARTLGKMLIQPLAQELATADRLVVIPDGPLHRVPFDLLPLADGKPAVERWAFGLAPSAAVAVRLWRSQEPRADTTAGASREVRILALGDPAFKDERTGGATEQEIFRSAFETRGGLRRLAGSGKEAREVARFAGGGAEIRLRDGASEQWLKHAALDQFKVIHLATHALVDETSIARTALALAPGSGEDGFLSPADLAALHLKADMVVLSACRTAGGVAIAGEGIQGLTMPLLSAGARAVVATQWPIEDRSTVRLVEDLYAGLARGLTVAEALRQTKLAAIGRGMPARDWAGFTVVGDPLVRVAVVAPPPRADWIRVAAIAAGLILLAGAAYFAMRWRGRSAERGPGRGVIAITHH